MLGHLLSKGWVLFLVTTVSLGLAGGGYAAWTTSLHVEGVVSTGTVGAVWDQQEDREFVGILDASTGQIVNRPVPPDKDIAECTSDLAPEQASQLVGFTVVNAYPSYTCEITLGALITGTIPVHISRVERMATDESSSSVLGTELDVDVALLRKVADSASETGFRCDTSQPIGVSTQLHQGDRFCAIIRIHATQAARQDHLYQGAVWIELVQWNLAGGALTPVNRPPVASAGGPYLVALGSGMVLDGSASFDPDAQAGDFIARAEWDINNDGQYDFDFVGSSPSSPAPLTAELSAGQLSEAGLTQTGIAHPIVLRVTDSFGLRGAASTTLTIFANGPVAVASVSPNPASCGETVRFSHSDSHHPDPDRAIIQYEWDFDYDGTFSADAVTEVRTEEFSLTKSTMMPRTVALRVTDDADPPKTAITVETVVRRNQPPLVEAGGPYLVLAGDDLTLDGSASSDPDAACGDSIVIYEWDLNNDGVYGDAQGASPTVPFETLESLGLGAGQHTIMLRVTDAASESSNGSARLDIIEDRPPTVRIASPLDGETFIEGQIVLVTASADDDVGVKSVTFSIDGAAAFVDVDAPYGFELTVPTGVTSLEIAATAEDSIGQTASDAVTIQVVPRPTITIMDAGVSEGSGVVSIPVSIFPSAPFDVSFEFMTSDGSAQADRDYVPTSGKLTIPANTLTGAIEVKILDDELDEDDETFFVKLLPPDNADLAANGVTVTVIDDDPEPGLAINDVSVTEGEGGTGTMAVFTVMLSSPSGRMVSVEFSTSDDTATADGDYKSASGRVTIGPGGTTATIPVTVQDDNEPELDETFFVNLSSPVNASLVRDQGVGTIIDDDGE